MTSTLRLMPAVMALGLTACLENPVAVAPERDPIIAAAPVAGAALHSTPLPALTYTVSNLVPGLDVGPLGGSILVGDGGEMVLRDANGDEYFWDGTATPLGGSGPISPFEIGSDGRVVGWAMVGNSLEPAVWDGGILSILPGGPGTAFDVNDGGTIVGASVSTVGDLLIWSPATGVQSYAVPGFDYVGPRFVNGSGDVLMTGFYTDPVTGRFSRAALIWSGGLPRPIASVCTDMDVSASLGTEYFNDAGQAIGGCRSQSRAWYFDGIAPRVVPTLGGSRTDLVYLNESGWAAGSSEDGTGTRHAVIYDGTVLTDLGLLGGDRSFARAVDGAGTVVGWVETAGQREAWVTEAGIPRLLPGLGGGETYVYDINGSGVIAGSAQDATGTYRAVAWQPASSEQIVANLQSALDELTAAGTLAAGPARAMRATLDAGVLLGFIQQVGGLVLAGKVDPEVGQAFIDAARAALVR